MDSSLALVSSTIVVEPRSNAMRTVTIDELDTMSDDEFYVFVDSAGGMTLETSGGQRDEMMAAHKEWVETLDSDIRDGVDWETATRSDWDLYAELRINGVGFQRAPAFAMA
jgi:hypothetical protein